MGQTPDASTAEADEDDQAAMSALPRFGVFLPRNAGGIRVPRPRCSDMSAPFCRWHLGPWTSRPTLPFPPFLFLSLSLFFFFLHFTALFILPVRGRNEVDEVSLTFSFASGRSGVLDG